MAEMIQERERETRKDSTLYQIIIATHNYLNTWQKKLRKFNWHCKKFTLENAVLYILCEDWEL